MKTGKILRKLAILASLVMLITSTVNTTYGFIVMSTDPITNIFVPDDVKVNGLTISKAVEHSLGENYKIPDNISFDFKVELGSYYASSRLVTTLGELRADESGVLNISVKPGATFGIEGLKEGTVVKVTEQTTTLAGFTVKGEATKQVTVGTDGTASIEFTNIYTPSAAKPDNVTVSGTKVLEGREWLDSDSFTFVLEQKEGENWTKLGEKTVAYDTKNTAFNQFDFSDVIKTVTFNKVGTYTFRISEVVGDLENIDYDKTVNHFTIKVTDVDMDGKLEINTVAGTENVKVAEENGTYALSVTFNNTFIPPVVVDPDPITVEIGIDKTVENTGTLKYGLEGFEFVLENTETLEKLAAISDKNGKAMLPLTFTKADVGKTYAYKLSETDHGLHGMTYDDDVYNITVAVSLSEDNRLIATLTIDGQTTQTLNASFKNVYHVDNPMPPQTADDTNLVFWLTMMIISASAFVALTVYDKKRQNAK